MCYVVKLANHTRLSTPLPVFTFSHPKRFKTILFILDGFQRDGEMDNKRFAKLRFKRNEDDPSCLMHGLAGYFETVLYKDVMLSTMPERHTPNMESWFEMFFPLKRPIRIPPGEVTIDVLLWRCVEKHKVALYVPSSSVMNDRFGMNGRSLHQKRQKFTIATAVRFQSDCNETEERLRETIFRFKYAHQERGVICSFDKIPRRLQVFQIFRFIESLQQHCGL